MGDKWRLQKVVRCSNDSVTIGKLVNGTFDVSSREMWTDEIFRTYHSQNIIDTHRILDRPSQVLPAEYDDSGLFMSLFPANSYSPEIWKPVK
jgi:hypothetical protein